MHLSRWLALILVSALLAPAAPAAAHEPGAQTDTEVEYLGLLLANSSGGQWTGEWLGAHPYQRVDSTYVVTIAVPSWDRLQTALRTAGSGAYLLADIPYVGDGMCAPGALRRWWSGGTVTPEGGALHWLPAPAVPDTAPSQACPLNLIADAPLLVQPAPATP